MRHKSTTIRIYNDYATETAQQLIDKLGEAQLGKMYAEQGRMGLRQVVSDELVPSGKNQSDITAVCLVLEQLLDSYRYKPLLRGGDGQRYNVFKADR